jgi:hypothetical protein
MTRVKYPCRRSKFKGQYCEGLLLWYMSWSWLKNFIDIITVLGPDRVLYSVFVVKRLFFIVNGKILITGIDVEIHWHRY